MDQLETEWLHLWERLLGEAPGTFDSPEVILNDLRGDRQTIKRAFEPLPGGAALSRRFLEVVEWSGEDPQKSGMYLYNVRPIPASDRELISGVQSYWTHLSVLVNYPISHPRVTVTRSIDARDRFERDFHAGNWYTLDEKLVEWFHDDVLESTDNTCQRAACFLIDPLYLLGCNYWLAYYVLWGLVEERFDCDPFRPLVDLWRRAATGGYSEAEETIHLYVPEAGA